MKEELTTKMHSEFTVSEAGQAKNDAFAVFQLVSDTISLDKALTYLDKTRDEVAPYIAEWNAGSSKKITL